MLFARTFAVRKKFLAVLTSDAGQCRDLLDVFPNVLDHSNASMIDKHGLIPPLFLTLTLPSYCSPECLFTCAKTLLKEPPYPY